MAYCKIQDDDVLNVSRHRPVICSLNVPQSDLVYDDRPSHIAWQKLDRSVLQLYESELNNLLLEQPLGLYENVYSCIDSRYNAIVDCIKTVSDATLPRTKFRSYLKPYWNSSLKDLHAAMRDKRRKWIAEGRPRGSMFSSFINYKEAKLWNKISADTLCIQVCFCMLVISFYFVNCVIISCKLSFSSRFTRI